jgi:hypothetical protein
LLKLHDHSSPQTPSHLTGISSTKRPALSRSKSTYGNSPHHYQPTEINQNYQNYHIDTQPATITASPPHHHHTRQPATITTAPNHQKPPKDRQPKPRNFRKIGNPNPYAQLKNFQKIGNPYPSSQIPICNGVAGFHGESTDQLDQADEDHKEDEVLGEDEHDDPRVLLKLVREGLASATKCRFGAVGHRFFRLLGLYCRRRWG